MRWARFRSSGSAWALYLFPAAVASVLIGLLAVATPAFAKPRGSDTRPNIVLIQADDAVVGDIQYLPNLQRLMARGGTSYANFFASYPLCGPSRATLLTGQYSHNNRVLSNFRANDGGHYTLRDLPGRLNQRNSLGPWLHRAGYRTAMVGKYLNDYGVLDRREVPPGWDRWVAHIDNSTYDYFNFGTNVDGRIRFRGERDYAEKHIRLARRTALEPPTGFANLLGTFRDIYEPWDHFGTQRNRDYTMDISGGYAARFVRRSAPARRPFFLYYSAPGPHAEDTNNIQGLRPEAPQPDPRPPARYRDTFDGVDLPRPASFNEADVSDKASNLSGNPLLTDGQIDEIEDNFRGRLGALRAVDDQIGRIARRLRKAGEMRNTFFIFNSDNGYIQGEHRLRSSKFLPYENSVRVPTLIRGPRVKRGKVRRGNAVNVDLAPTILDMAGVRPGRRMDGISLLPNARGRKRLPKRDVLLAANRPLFKFTTPLTAFDLPYYGVRSGRYKYIRWSFGETELYDLKADPNELQNLAGDPGHAETAARLEKVASRLTKCRGTACR